MSMQRLMVISLVLFVSACASTPRQRYIRALDAQYRGDTKTYFDELIALAHDEPESREGRRARAILGASNVLAPALLVVALGASASTLFNRTGAPAELGDTLPEERVQNR